MDVDADLHDLGIDSLGLAELLGLLEDSSGASKTAVIEREALSSR